MKKDGVLLRKRNRIKTDIFDIQFKGEISFVLKPKDKVLTLEPLDIEIPLKKSKMEYLIKKKIDYLCLDFIYNSKKNIKYPYIDFVRVKGFGGKVWKKNY